MDLIFGRAMKGNARAPAYSVQLDDNVTDTLANLRTVSSSVGRETGSNPEGATRAVPPPPERNNETLPVRLPRTSFAEKARH
mmetsp:Transcript_2933/g.5516  ORF Transcript_2933/g.5516 Transcript_2933/m.5516 type:complete len:82 (+) Transcript_2933:1155-1400(+)